MWVRCASCLDSIIKSIYNGLFIRIDCEAQRVELETIYYYFIPLKSLNLSILWQATFFIEYYIPATKLQLNQTVCYLLKRQMVVGEV
jgi:hypothetical protein